MVKVFRYQALKCLGPRGSLWWKLLAEQEAQRAVRAAELADVVSKPATSWTRPPPATLSRPRSAPRADGRPRCPELRTPLRWPGPQTFPGQNYRADKAVGEGSRRAGQFDEAVWRGLEMFAFLHSVRLGQKTSSEKSTCAPSWWSPASSGPKARR